MNKVKSFFRLIFNKIKIFFTFIFNKLKIFFKLAFNKTKSFFKIVKYEYIKISRNKVIFGMLLGFSILLLVIMATSSAKVENSRIAICTNGADMEQVEVLDFVDELIPLDRLIEVDNIEDGKMLVNKDKADILISLNVTEGEDDKDDIITATIFYNESSLIGRQIKEILSNEMNKYSYEKVKEVLGKWGLTLNEEYFELLTFETSNGKDLKFSQFFFAMEVGGCIAVILMLGLAYSLARDNETGVSKNANYIPIGRNRYLFSKIIPYFTLGVVEAIIIFLLGKWLFQIDYAINFFLIILATLLYILSTISLGLLTSMLKSQIATVFIDMVTIMLPIFAFAMSSMANFPIVIRIVFYCLPLSSFVSLANGMMFNGIVQWWAIGVFAAQIVVYYLLALLVLKRRESR